MKILHVNFSDSGGGAAQAVLRLHNELLNKNIESYIFVREKLTNNKNIVGPIKKIDLIKINIKKKISRNLKFFFKTTNTNTHSLNLISSGIIDQINEFKPDYVNLHWIGNETISIKEISKIKSKIVWTLHDMWPFCGAEHYTNDNRYIEGYNSLNRPIYEKKFDINKYVWLQKKKYFNDIEKIICTSNWMLKKVSNSFLFKKKNIKKIPLSLDQSFWFPVDKSIARKILSISEKKLTICFGAENYFNNNRKGFDIFKDAINNFDSNVKLQVLLFGEDKKFFFKNKNIETHNIGIVKDELTMKIIFSASDFVIMPSRIEAFGQIVLESLFCGTPCVILKDTAMEDMIQHKSNGFICSGTKHNHLSEGITWCVNNLGNFNRKSISSEISKQYSSKVLIDDYLNFLSK